LDFIHLLFFHYFLNVFSAINPNNKKLARDKKYCKKQQKLPILHSKLIREKKEIIEASKKCVSVIIEI